MNESLTREPPTKWCLRLSRVGQVEQHHLQQGGHRQHFDDSFVQGRRDDSFRIFHYPNLIIMAKILRNNVHSLLYIKFHMQTSPVLGQVIKTTN